MAIFQPPGYPKIPKMPVYIGFGSRRSTESSFIKIGYSSSPVKPASPVIQASPVTLVKLANFTGDKNFTGEVHRDNSAFMDGHISDLYVPTRDGSLTSLGCPSGWRWTP